MSASGACLGVLGDLSDGLETDLKASCDGSLGEPLGERPLDSLFGLLAGPSGGGLWGEGSLAVFAEASGGAAAVGAVLDDGIGLVAMWAANGMNDHGNLARQEPCQKQRD